MDASISTSPYRLASRLYRDHSTLVPLKGERVGGNKIHIIAGPCAVESRDQIIEIAHLVKKGGATALRGGAFKPRTSPYSFQGCGEKALEWLAEARKQTDLAIVTEVLEPAKVSMVCQYADVLQIGSRNMQNIELLKAAARSQHSILLKRGMGNTIDELLFSAEYILQENPNVMLCERGIRTFENRTRNTFDINAIPVLKSLTHLPVIADPSHGTGNWQYVEAVARGAVAAGVDGLIIEVHNDPGNAFSDGEQSLLPERFYSLMEQLNKIAVAIDRTL